MRRLVGVKVASAAAERPWREPLSLILAVMGTRCCWNVVVGRSTNELFEKKIVTDGSVDTASPLRSLV